MRKRTSRRRAASAIFSIGTTLRTICYKGLEVTSVSLRETCVSAYSGSVTLSR